MMDSKRSGRRAAERSFGGRAQGDRAATQPGHADAAAESNGDEVRSRLEAAVVHTGAGLVELDRIIDPQLQCRPQHHFPAQPMTIDSLDKIPRLYHFTDRRNLDSIRHGGGLRPLRDLRRRGVAIPAPGGNQWSHDADEMVGVDRYVHLCFRPVHPMAYIARQDGRIIDTVFLEISPHVLQIEGVLFTPDVSNKSGVMAIPIAQSVIDYEVLYTRTNWLDPAIKQRLDQAEKCEVLVPSRIPLDWIRNI
jgi:hypothetical protein